MPLFYREGNHETLFTQLHHVYGFLWYHFKNLVLRRWYQTVNDIAFQALAIAIRCLFILNIYICTGKRPFSNKKVKVYNTKLTNRIALRQRWKVFIWFWSSIFHLINIVGNGCRIFFYYAFTFNLWIVYEIS